ncbi:hypothetical protein [Tenacibaculum maritimum]|uniref:hypothetical protein n=1 Tax=Tenacibaculum maritimum TaxID=107401 RepID=UPI0012E43077|nr:hypothetical protein [Tenacibaculum maritimum]CAA0239327.1 conserved membrane hypothetical protein [Tenacibaculum maritimum]CAA0249584.1 conserved membrane hypothetical protein [Tenacibaculum maritimum]
MTNKLEETQNKVAVIDEAQMKQFQSLYYLIKGKRDTDIKLFTDFKQFEYSDIIELNSKIYKKLELHQLVTDIVNVTVGLNNKEIKSFGNWNEFVNTDWNISACTKYISLEWDFNLILPNQTHQVPQTHTLRVRIGNNLKPSEMIQVVFQDGEEYDLDEAHAQMSCKIDFINSQICNELKTVVSEWYDALKKNSEEHKLIKFILKHEVKFQNFIILSFLTAGTILVNYLFSVLYESSISFLPSDNAHKLFLFLTSSVVALFLFYQSGKLYADRMMRKQIGRLRRNPMFDFTKGDKNKFSEVAKDNKKYLIALLKTITIGISVNGLSALIGFILEKIIE